MIEEIDGEYYIESKLDEGPIKYCPHCGRDMRSKNSEILDNLTAAGVIIEDD